MMESYQETGTMSTSGASGADESIQPRHPSIVVIDPPAMTAPLRWTADDADPFCRVIDTLPNTAAQHCAAIIYDLLFDYAQQRIITSACRMPIALIAGVTGYSKGAMWRSLPFLARAGLLVWGHADTGNVTVQLTVPDLATIQALPLPQALVMRERASIISPSLRLLAIRGDIALGFAGNKQTITVLRSRKESSQ